MKTNPASQTPEPDQAPPGRDSVDRIVRQFRALEMGEIVLQTDEIYNDHKREWVEPEWSVGKPAPDPAYTSHRQFRRSLDSLPNASDH